MFDPSQLSNVNNAKRSCDVDASGQLKSFMADHTFQAPSLRNPTHPKMRSPISPQVL